MIVFQTCRLWVQTPIRPLLMVFKEMREKDGLYIDISNGKTYENYAVFCYILIIKLNRYGLTFMITD